MKWLYIIVLVFILLVGIGIVYQESHEARDAQEIRDFVNSRGNTRIPSAWKKDVGKGI